MTPLHMHYHLQDLHFFYSNVPIEHGAHPELYTALLALPVYRVLREIRRGFRA